MLSVQGINWDFRVKVPYWAYNLLLLSNELTDLAKFITFLWAHWSRFISHKGFNSIFELFSAFILSIFLTSDKTFFPFFPFLVCFVFLMFQNWHWPERCLGALFKLVFLIKFVSFISSSNGLLKCTYFMNLILISWLQFCFSLLSWLFCV